MKPFALFLAALLLTSCSVGRGSSPGEGTAALPLAVPGTSLVRNAASGKIQHVVIIVQENRSFDNMFQGYPGANTVSSGLNSQGQTITLQPYSLKNVYEIDHSAKAFFEACDGSPPGQNCKNDGFDQEFSQLGRPIRSTCTCRIRNPSRISIWPRSSCWPTTCSVRRSTRVSSRTSTSSERRLTPRWICRRRFRIGAATVAQRYGADVTPRSELRAD